MAYRESAAFLFISRGVTIGVDVLRSVTSVVEVNGVNLNRIQTSQTFAFPRRQKFPKASSRKHQLRSQASENRQLRESKYVDSFFLLLFAITSVQSRDSGVYRWGSAHTRVRPSPTALQCIAEFPVRSQRWHKNIDHSKGRHQARVEGVTDGGGRLRDDLLALLAVKSIVDSPRYICYA